jgi:23S rRNA pseudouridine2605 synthase
MAMERLQKLMAAAGLGSRRGCEQMIAAGRVLLNGKTAGLGMSADPLVDKITVDGTVLPTVASRQTFAMYKPRGVISSLAPQGNRATVRDLIPAEGRFFPVGRLDKDSEGLILLTNDGELAQRISHPRYEVEKEYRVLVARRPSEEQLGIWRRGVVLEDEVRTAPMEVVVESPEGRGAWLRVVMHEGRKHELREIGWRIGLPVVRIIRRRIGGLMLGGLRPGQYRELTPAEIASLHGPDAKPRSPKPAAKKGFPPYRSAGKHAPDKVSSWRGDGAKPAYRKPERKGRFPRDSNAGKHTPAKVGSGRGDGAKPAYRKPEGKDRFPRDSNAGKHAPAKVGAWRGDGAKPVYRKPEGRERFTRDRKSESRAPVKNTFRREENGKPPSRKPAGKNRYPLNQKSRRRARKG